MNLSVTIPGWIDELALETASKVMTLDDAQMRTDAQALASTQVIICDALLSARARLTRDAAQQAGAVDREGMVDRVLEAQGLDPMSVRTWSQNGNSVELAKAERIVDALAPAIAAGAQADGWRCFHCGETFTDKHAARDHFGDDCEANAACIQVLTETEKAIVEDRRLWRDRAFRAEDENEKLGHQLSSVEWEIRTKFKGCNSLTDVFHAYDSMEGRALAAEEHLQALASQGAAGADVPISAGDAIKFALTIDDTFDAVEFLATWNEGNWVVLQEQWPEAFIESAAAPAPPTSDGGAA